MTKDKQIEEIKKVLMGTCKRTRSMQEDYMQDLYAKALYTKGYRKASDVANKIFAEIESKLMLNKAIHCGQKFYYTRIADDIAELKKKYTEGCDG